MTAKQKIQSLINAANATTGESAADLTTAVTQLIDGYGGGGGISATVNITDAGAGATVTATDGSHTFTCSANSSGAGTMTITAAGTYTFTSTVKGQRKTLTVTSDITYTLSFNLILYDAGEQNTAVTGGWTKRNYSVNGSASAGDAVLETARMSLRGSSASTARSTGLGTVNAMDLTGYSNMCLTYSSNSGSSNDNRLRLVLMPEGELNTANALRDSGEQVNTTTAKTVKIPITPVTAPCQVAVIAHRKSNTALYWYVTKVWLE